MDKYNQGLFYDRVPKLVQLLLYNQHSLYSKWNRGSNRRLHVGKLYFCYRLGAAMPLVVRLKARFRSKEF